MVVYTDKSKISWSQEFTALRAVQQSGGGMPQESNRTGLQEVRTEEGGVQPSRAEKESGKEGGEGGGEAGEGDKEKEEENKDREK